MCKDFISQPIESIINSRISMSIFPSELKIACVTPLFKGGDKNDPKQLSTNINFVNFVKSF